ncbi:MAG TPA: hypothetical protein VFG83_01480 [Kofleriaceae bacterium]|nr:hypothetical protein [Kofleriaceae bacterium]
MNDLALRPVAWCTRASLLSREVTLSLSSAAVDLLFSRSHILSEGRFERTTDERMTEGRLERMTEGRSERMTEGRFEKSAYFGSTMITFDLARMGELVRDGDDPAVAERVGALCANDDRIRERARHLARSEAEKLAGMTLDNAQIDIAVRAQGSHIHLDIDVSAAAAARAAKG